MFRPSDQWRKDQHLRFPWWCSWVWCNHVVGCFLDNEWEIGFWRELDGTYFELYNLWFCYLLLYSYPIFTHDIFPHFQIESSFLLFCLSQKVLSEVFWLNIWKPHIYKLTIKIYKFNYYIGNQCIRHKYF